ncbi:hypothetical protein ACLB2K_075306 [Fragaria x ananassa]
MEISGSAEETVVDIAAATSVTAVVTRDEEHVSILWEKIKNIFLLRHRRDSFLLACMLAVSLDPLFLYIPVIDEDLKCLIVDGKLRKVALACRLLTDFHYIMDNLAQFEFGSRDMWRSNILTSFFATVPVPHVPMFSPGGERSLDLICGYLKPVIYTENSFIIQEGDPVDKMLFIIQGVAFIYRCSPDGSGSSNTSSITKGDHYGEELLNLAPDIDNLSLPKSKWSVKCSTYVEGFILMAEDLIKIKISLDD